MGVILQVGDVVKMNYISVSGSQVAINTGHVRVQSLSIPELQLEPLVTQMAVRVLPLYEDLYNVQCYYAGAIGYKLDAVTGKAIARAQKILYTEGTAEGDTLPRQVCGIATSITELSGPQGRGRIYVPFPPVSAMYENDPTRPTEAYRGLCKDLADKIRPAIDTTITLPGGTCEVRGVIAHRTTPFSITPVYDNVGRLAWATQRRRGDYGKMNRNPLT